MIKKVFYAIPMFVGFWCLSQTEIYFKYDEAGNQRYRGPNVNAKTTSKDLLNNIVKNEIILSEKKLEEKSILDEKTFWKQMRIYPVPVNDFLTIDWTDELDELIATFSIYQHNTIHWKFQQENLPNLNKELKINMTGYDWGVYILQIKLKDGRVFNKNITKR